MHAQALDGSARGVLSTVRRLGWLQMDPIATVATPQELVLFSRLGPFDRSQLNRLLWKERKLFEYDAFIYPIEDLPLQRARMARRRRTFGTAKRDEWVRSSCGGTRACAGTSCARSSATGPCSRAT